MEAKTPLSTQIFRWAPAAGAVNETRSSPISKTGALMGKPAKGNEIDAGGGDSGGIRRRDPARSHAYQAATDHTHRLA
jgi:hypothetical protein